MEHSRETFSTPPPEAPGANLLAAWWSLGQVMKRHIAPILEREHRLDFKDFVAMSNIAAGAQYPGLLCERMVLSPSNVSRVLEDLVRHDLVRRSLDPQDSRRVRLELTERGEEILAATRATMLGILERGLSTLPEAQVRVFTETMLHLVETLTNAAEARS